jgi:hypothetical protein
MNGQGKFEYHMEGRRVYAWQEPRKPVIVEELSSVIVDGRRSQTLLLYDGTFQLIDHVYDSFPDPRRESMAGDATSSGNAVRLSNIIRLFDEHSQQTGKTTARKQGGAVVADHVDRYAKASVRRWC